MTITCGIQPFVFVTMAMEVLYNTCNMCICDLPNMNPLIPRTCGLRLQAYISGKSPMPMLQLLLIYFLPGMHANQ